MHEWTDDYHGREQTWLKHLFLAEYVVAWGHKWGSVRRYDVDLWYVDCFAGPWASNDEERNDTSIAIGLRALNTAAETWAQRGHHIKLHAVFVEKNPTSFRALKAFAEANAGAVDVRTFLGTFGEHVDQIDYLIGSDPAFVFIDPTGWTGVDMRFVAKLARRDHRDVMVNVMVGDIKRFYSDPRDFIRKQMLAFFGPDAENIRANLSEPELMREYRKRLGKQAQVKYVADVAVPVPTSDRTRFRLVVAAHHPAAIDLFRSVEAKVLGKVAGEVRAAAKARKRTGRSGQGELTLVPPTDRLYAEGRAAAERELRELLPKKLARAGEQRFGDLWPRILCEYHIKKSELGKLVFDMAEQRIIEIRGLGPRQKVASDDHVLALPPPDPPAP